MSKIEIGIGGLFEGLAGGAASGRLTDALDFRAALRDLAAEVQSYDPQAELTFIEALPPQDRAEAFGEAALEFGMPVRQFTDTYVIGGNEDRPDALDHLRANLQLAQRTGTVERLNLQIVGDNLQPTITALVDFYCEAESLAADYGMTLFTETHVDRFTYDPRRLIAVHEALLDRTGGRLGLRVNADLSHYVHQLGNTHFPNWNAIESNALNLNPLDPDNYVSRNLIQTGLIGYGHLRMAVPNNLPRGMGSIQYPVVDPQSDEATAHLPYGGLKKPWEEDRTQFWWVWYRELFGYLLTQNQTEVVRFATEFIGNGQPWEYRVHPYRNLYQNIAMLSKAQKMVRTLSAGLESEAV